MRINMWSGIQRMFAVVATVLALLSVTARAQTQGHWVKLAPVPRTAEEYQIAAANGKIYLIGGNENPGTGSGIVSLGLVQEYDPTTDKWTKKKDIPFLSNHMAAAEYRGKIYLFGGVEELGGGKGEMPIAKSWEYDPAADSWKALAAMPTARTAASAVEVGGKIYVIGGTSVHPGMNVVPITGNTPHQALGTNEAYDPATDRWETRQMMPTARNHTAIGAVDGKIYVIGGRAGASGLGQAAPVNITEVYDPATDTWGVPRAKMPTNRDGFGWTTYKGKIYVAGGQAQDLWFNGVFAAFEAYDPATNSWALLPPVNIPRHGLNLAAIGNRIYVMGGHIANGPAGGEPMHSNLNEAFEFANQ
jgi:N-acetylneuraminic acid mutarotase